MLAYRTVQLLLRAAVGVYFQDVHITGLENVPDEGDAPVLFAGNHPNSLIDPVLILTTSGRVTHFAAKDKLFAWPLKPVLLALGAVPIARAMDHGDGTRDNTSSLRALVQVLVETRAVGIFPEGLSHDAPSLARLRTGAARVALDVNDVHPNVPLVIVPTGLTYLHRKRVRSRALVQYGEPIRLDADWATRWREDPRGTATALTDLIERRLRGLTVNAPDWQTLRVLDGVRRLYQPRRITLEERVELARRFCEVYPSVADAPDVQALYADVAAYLDALDGLGLTDRDLIRAGDAHLMGRALGNLASLLIWLPLALPGAVVHLPLGIAILEAGRRFAPRSDVVGTSRLMLGLLGVMTCYAVLPVVAATYWGTGPGLMVAGLLPLSGYASLRLVERGTSLRRLGRAAWASLTLGRRVQALREQRAVLQERVVDLVVQYKPVEMAALFPRK